MKILFVDDDPENVETVARILRDAYSDDPSAEVRVVMTVEDAILAVHHTPFDLVVTDLFIPLGPERGALGPRARRYAEQLEHLGGLVLIDEIDRLANPPILLVHTACTDHIIIELLGQRVSARVPKPAPTEVLLDAILRGLREG